MLRPGRHADEGTDNEVPDEARIRADERANVERELHATHEQRQARDRDASGEDPSMTTDDNRVADRERDRDAVVSHGDGRDDAGLAEERNVEEDQLEEIEVVRKRSFSFGQLLTMLVGAALVVLGVFALIETGVDTPLDQPVEQVMGYGHTPLLGILEIVAGGLLVLFALRPGGRWFVAAVGVALLVGGVLILAELDWTVDELGAEQEYAWIPIVAGLVALLSSLLTPRRYQRMTGVPAARLS